MPLLHGYGFLYRPPMPGAMPREGLVDCIGIEGKSPTGHHLWGFAIYNRELTEQEIDSYELEALPPDYRYPV